MSGIKNFITLFPHYFDLQSNKNLLNCFVHDYYFVVVLLIASTIYYIIVCKYGKLLLMLSFFVAYCFLVNISYPNGADQFYIENQYLILSFIVVLPFSVDILPKIRNSKIEFGIVCLICAIGIFRIINAHTPYSNRLNWNRNLLLKTEEFPQKKLIIPSTHAPKDTLYMTWASSYEFWLLSTIKKGVSRSIIIEEKENEFDWALPCKKSFITRWGVIDYTDLNKKYFVFNDTSS